MSMIDDQTVVKVLRQYNPWWSDAGAIRAVCPPERRLVFDEAMHILQHESLRRFVLLSGMRRVGKTTLLYQMIDELLDAGVPAQNILYVTFDNPMLKVVSMGEVLETYAELFSTMGEKYVFFDEVQYAQDWERWLKVLYDSRNDLRLVATGSASPLLEKGSEESGAGRWSVLKVGSLSFYEYCKLLNLPEPDLTEMPSISELVQLPKARAVYLMENFSPLVNAFNRYLLVGGFPELALAEDDAYAQRRLREDVVDRVIKRDVMTLFNIRSPLMMEKLLVYLCLHSTQLFNVTTAAKEIGQISPVTLESYLSALEMANLIYIAKPIGVGSKAVLKGKPKIFVADAAIRNAVLMIDDVLSDETELGATIETTVYKHMVSYFEGSMAEIGYYRKSRDNQKEVDVVVGLPRGTKILCEVKYRNQSHLPESDAIVELCRDETARVAQAFLITKRLEDVGPTQHETNVPILRIPALPFLYLLGKQEAEGSAGRL